MAESDNDSLSVDDLVVAINGWAPQTRSKASADGSSKGDASASSMDEDELDLLSALGLAPRTPKVPEASSRPSGGAAPGAEDQGALRAEQQVRSQQWQQEMRRRDARFARMAPNDEEVADAEAAQPDMPFIEEGGLSKGPSSAAASTAPASVEPRFERPQEYEPVHIPEPTFLSQQPSDRPMSALEGREPVQEPLHGQPLQPFGSAAEQGFKGFTRRVIEPLDASAAQSAEASGEPLPTFSTIEPLQPLTQQVEDTIQGARAAASEGSASGVVKRSFFSSDAPMSPIQRLDEVQQLSSTDDQESFVERKQVSLADSTDAVATGMLGSIQPMAGGSSAPSAPYVDTAPGTAEATFETFVPHDHFEETEEVGRGTVDTAEPAEAGEPIAATAAASDEPVSALAASGDQSMAQAPVSTAPPMAAQPGAPVPGQPVPFDQFGNPMPTGQFAPPMDQQPFAAPQQMGPMQPMQPMQPVPGVAPGTPMSDGQLDVQRHSAGSKRNSILGIILIIVALLCAVMAVGMLSGIFDMDSASNTRASSSAASSAQASDAAPDEGTTEAVYTYVVRGVDGTTHEATETATFNADGFLEGSTIELQVNDAETANALLEQLKSEFGSSVVSSEADENHVLITLDINRDDLTKEAYTELLLANMTEFKQIS